MDNPTQNDMKIRHVLSHVAGIPRRAVLGWLTQWLGDNTEDPGSASPFPALSRSNSEAESLHSPRWIPHGPTTASKGRKKDHLLLVLFKIQ